MVLQAIRYQRGKLEILDQLKLPYEEQYLHIQSEKDAWKAIKKMQVRGAPAIAIVAALSVAIWLDMWLRKKDTIHEDEPCSASDMVRKLQDKLNFLVTSRPTAVNLSDAARKLEHVVIATSQTRDATARSVAEACLAAAEQMLVNDIYNNERIGKHGAEWLLSFANATAPEDKISILTHCNTGSLATAGYGTALGVVRALHAQHRLQHCFYTETRPYNQGCRLTGYELMHDKIPATLVTDSMAAALLRLKAKPENIAAIVVGADRVAANGDTANKIGTYGLGILARHHGVKFVVAAPKTTIDLQTKSGEDIIIEERQQIEVTTMRGPPVKRAHRNSVEVEVEVGVSQEISIAAANTKAWNPAFDVTPADLIDGIVTEDGVVEKENGAFNLQTVFETGLPALNGELRGSGNQLSS